VSIEAHHAPELPLGIPPEKPSVPIAPAFSLRYEKSGLGNAQ